MKKRIPIFILSLGLLSSLLVGCDNSLKQEFKTLNEQTGIILGNANFNGEAILNNEAIEYYKSYSKNITLKFETYHVDTRYENKIIINDEYEYDLVPSKDSNETFYATNIDLLGLNIKDGVLKVKFVSGKDNTDIAMDTFYVRNVVLMVSGEEIWSNEYTKANYLNQKIGLGESTINSDMRFGIIPERVFTFNVNDSLLDCKGYMLQEDDFKDIITLKSNSNEYEYPNPKATHQINLIDDETISEDRVIELTHKNAEKVNIYLDGIKVNLPLKLTSSCWVAGEHTLRVELFGKMNTSIVEEYEFTLQDKGEPIGNSTYKVFNNGVSGALSNSITELGVETSLNEDIVTPFAKNPFINFEISNNESCNVVWKGRANKNRVAFLQLFNYVTREFDTVATKKVTSSEEDIILAANYSGLSQYISGGKTIARVSSESIQDEYENPTGTILHLSDVQYIVEKSAAQGDSILGKEAKAALTSLSEYVVEMNPDYSLISGDLVQETINIQEWEDVTNYLIDPILEGNVPLGVSSGNHDVGGLKAINPNGSNGLDDVLVYEYYQEYVGEAKFNSYSYYGENYDNNRSHYDLMNIAGHEFMFLHLGWGSSFYGVHVSNKDIAWAKTVLDKHLDKTVVLSTHDYLSDVGERNLTGEYVFNELVKEYDNIKFVFSGHVNGSSMKIDYLDDNNDGINDRQVLQLLTDYQEEEDLYGATFVRTLNLYADYNNILFDIYSPFYSDNDIIVFSNPDVVKKTSRFEYPFDISNDGFGLITKEFK